MAGDPDDGEGLLPARHDAVEAHGQRGGAQGGLDRLHPQGDITRSEPHHTCLEAIYYKKYTLRTYTRAPFFVTEAHGRERGLGRWGAETEACPIIHHDQMRHLAMGRAFLWVYKGGHMSSEPSRMLP